MARLTQPKTYDESIEIMWALSAIDIIRKNM
jgi:hypothetical protein